jgi:hypothetical protein
MSKSLKAPNIRELILPFVGQQFARIAQPMGGRSGSKTLCHPGLFFQLTGTLAQRFCMRADRAVQLDEALAQIRRRGRT